MEDFLGAHSQPREYGQAAQPEAGLSLSLFLENLQEEIPGEGKTAILLTCS